MRARVVSMVLLGLAACRGASPSPPPPEPADRATLVEPREREPSAQPAAPVEPPAPFSAEESVDVGGRPVGVRIDGGPSGDAEAPSMATLLVSLDGATSGDRLLAIPTGFEGCEQASAVVEPVAGEPSPLVLAQAFCERGEDEFTRDILSAVVHVGDAATPPRVLWQGGGSFSSSFGVCQHTDIPLAQVPASGTLRIAQLTEVEHVPDRDLPEIRCRAKKARTVEVAKIAF